MSQGWHESLAGGSLPTLRIIPKFPVLFFDIVFCSFLIYS